MSKKEKNASFICITCEKKVQPLNNGSYRNHCPFCLTSIHVDDKPGDRKNLCKGVMTPFKAIYNRNKGWQIVHRCLKCSHEQANKIADSSANEPDNWEMIIKLTEC